MKELPQIEYDDDDDFYDASDSYYDYFLKEKQIEEGLESEKKFLFDLSNRFNKKELEDINKRGLVAPNELIKKDEDYLKQMYDDTNKVIKSLNGELAGRGRKINKTQEDKYFLYEKRSEQEILVKYKDTIGDVIKAVKKYKTGKGIFFLPFPPRTNKKI